MNNKNKVLLTSVGLALLSGIAATSSTFAWFTTTRTASISYSNATVTSSQSNLILTYKGSTNTFTTAPAVGSTGNISIVGGNQVTDISGDGISFFKPIWSADTGVATKIDPVTSAEGFYVEINVNIAIFGQTNMNVYLGQGTGITPVSAAAADIKAVAASRMAVLVGATPTVPTILYAPDADYDVAGTPTNGHQYLDAASSTPVDVFANNAVADASKEIMTSPAVVAGPFATSTTVAGATAGSLVASLTTTSTNVDVTFRVWIEGEDVDAINQVGNTALGGIFNVAINLYALEA